jgi:hypothetical protein
MTRAIIGSGAYEVEKTRPESEHMAAVDADNIRNKGRAEVVGATTAA